VASIKRIMNEFDFDRVHNIMVKTKWTYAELNKETDKFVMKTPSIQNLKKTALRLLKECKKKKNRYASTGGFTAMRIKKEYFLFWGIDSLSSNY
jgi:hypothetical protein